MVAIAMTREMGTLGKDVAESLAASLDLKVIHSELIEHDLARRLGVQDSAVHHYLEGNASLLEKWKIDKSKLSQYTAEEILELARSGNVLIRGWGAVAVLRAVPHVLRVRVCAPMVFREQVIMARLGLATASEARREIEKNDAAHARLMRAFFGVNWENPQLYHVVVNTGCVPVDTCARVVRLLTDDPALSETEQSREILSDKLIEARVRAQLGAVSRLLNTDDGVNVRVQSGRVVISGVVGPGIALADAEAKIRTIEGVKHVENRALRAAPNYGV